MSTYDVVARLRAEGAAQFQSSMARSATSVRSVGTESDKANKQIKDTAKRWVAGATAAFAASEVLKDSVKNAVDLGEQINKTAVVFRGPGARAVLAFSKTTASALGISQAEALEAAGTFGNMLVPMGFARTRAATMSTSMVKLAADMASFNNASPAETLDALRAGLAGESEPLRKFGVFLSDARLKQQALSMHLYKGKGNLSASAKAAATYALILKDTTDAQGDFGRTSSSLANQQRILRAQYANVTAQLGAKLIPILSFLVRNLKAVGIAVGVLTGLWLAYRAATIVATVAQAAFNVTLAVNPIFLVIAAVAALVAGFVLLYTKVGWFRAGVDAVWNALKVAFGWIKANWPLLVGILTGPFGIAVVLIIRYWDKVKGAAIAVFNWLKANWPLIVGVLTGPMGMAVVLIIRYWDRIKGAISTAVSWIKGRLDALVQFFKDLPGRILSAVGDLAGKLAKAILPGGVAGKLIGKAVGGIKSVAGKLNPANLFQHGGVMLRAGPAIVGEAGPELVYMPGGTRITPSISGAMATTAHFYLDRRLIATAVAQADADQRARR